MERIIGSYEGREKGALILAFGAIHGNETAGVGALQEIFKLLEREPAVNSGFIFRGKLIGMIGNLRALSTGVRYIGRDLNRMWTPAFVSAALNKPERSRSAEESEIVEIHRHICEAIAAYQPDNLILLDLHTTSAEGGIFCIPTNTPSSLRLARALNAPVIMGLLDGIEGTLLQYAGYPGFCIDGLPRNTIGVAFEGGQHHDPNSVSRCIAALVNCLRAAGCVHPDDVDTRHEAILAEYSRGLPRVSRLEYVHRIQADDHFRMRPGFVNFQKVAQGEHLADDARGPVKAPLDGRILMPLYQAQGSDGFFIIQEQQEGV